MLAAAVEAAVMLTQAPMLILQELVELGAVVMEKDSTIQLVLVALEQPLLVVLQELQTLAVEAAVAENHLAEMALMAELESLFSVIL
jgi:hypothetical protein